MSKVKVEFQRSYTFQEVFSTVDDSTEFVEYVRTFGFSAEKGDWQQQTVKVDRKQVLVYMYNTLSDVQSSGGRVKK